MGLKDEYMEEIVIPAEDITFMNFIFRKIYKKTIIRLKIFQRHFPVTITIVKRKKKKAIRMERCLHIPLVINMIIMIIQHNHDQVWKQTVRYVRMGKLYV